MMGTVYGFVIDVGHIPVIILAALATTLLAYGLGLIDEWTCYGFSCLLAGIGLRCFISWWQYRVSRQRTRRFPP
jgi:hypothetical protein